MIAIIKNSPTTEAARASLSERFGLSEIRIAVFLADFEEFLFHELAQYVVVGENELKLFDACVDFVDVLLQLTDGQAGEGAQAHVHDCLGLNLADINYAAGNFNAEDFYADDEMIITISHLGYIKRTPLAEFRAQNRGGVGSRGSQKRDADFIVG